MNVVVLDGHVAKEPTIRQLPSGDTLVAFDVRVASEPAASVPVTWIGAGERRPAVAAGDNVVVVGSVHRRFYRSGGQLASRVDVRAERIGRGGPARRHRIMLAAADRIGAAVDGQTGSSRTR